MTERTNEAAGLPETAQVPKTLEDGLRERLEALPEYRRNRLAEMWGDMTPRERMLFKEGAVMGFVRGSMYAEGRATRAKYPDLFADEGDDPRIPLDSVIVLDVLGGCDSFPDIYPLVTGYEAADEGPAEEMSNPPGLPTQAANQEPDA